MANTTLVIFGAGASAGAFPRNRVRQETLQWGLLPVTAELFAPRPAFVGPIAAYHRLQSIMDRLSRPRNGLEEEMQTLLDEAGTSSQRKRQLLACRYYLRDIINGCTAECGGRCGWVTHYGTLADLLVTRVLDRGGDVLIVSFNYDVLVDRACSAAGLLELADVDSYVQPHAALIKIHGSTNWVRDVEFVGEDPPRSYNSQLGLVDHAERMALKGTRWMYPLDNFNTALPDRTVPAIAVPTMHKTPDQYECPRHHVDAMRHRLPDVGRILIVGWKAQEPHFLPQLAGALARREVPILVANGPATEADGTRQRLRDAGINPAPATPGFLDATRALNFELLMRDRSIVGDWL